MSIVLIMKTKTKCEQNSMDADIRNLSREKNHKLAAWLGIGVFGGLATALVTISWPFVMPAFRKVVLPYVPATVEQIENVLKALQYRRPFEQQQKQQCNSDTKLIDLGSGDGRIVIACAQQGFLSYGVELNPWLVVYSKFCAYRQNVHKLAKFQRKNLFKVDLADYDKIILFGVQSMMPLIEQKIRDDCNRKQRSTTLIACRFPLPNWHPYMTFGSGVDQVWLYKYYPSYHSKK
uniref:Protein N-lysine methyltransferase FAM173B-like isoform X2 n=1 Tax=Dermatophagoides pteronyssinus TaxID=6956 RepID=A0A6P6YKQ5_DERPT|nr:protein N-lysine methyltransferase FAM173B-like isoform X2 [Dermatophagoides pteronyssinus]